MTREHRLLIGLDEIKALVFQCATCNAKISIAPDQLNMPPQSCPCGHGWDWDLPLDYKSTESPFKAFISSLKRLKDPAYRRFGFTVLIELEAPKADVNA